MAKKRFGIIAVLSVLILLSSIMIYWFYFSKPDTFPTNEQLIEEINLIFPVANASIIQDTVPIDERHVLVPFVSNEDNYSLSYWVWQKHKWKVDTIDTKGEPKVWKINRKDPSTFYLVWNIHPKDQLSSITYYLIRDRGYQISEGIENYLPRVQMEKKVSLRGKSYGAFQLPDDWAGIMNSLIKLEPANKPDLFFNDFSNVHNIYFGWTPKNQSDKYIFPKDSVNGSGFTNGKMDIEHMMILGKEDLELPM